MDSPSPQQLSPANALRHCRSSSCDDFAINLHFVRGKSMAKSLHSWTPQENELLVRCLTMLVEDGSWDNENGFKPYMYDKIEKMIEDMGSGCSIKANDIRCRLKRLKCDWMTICGMLHGHHNLGFQWNAKEKRIVASETVWNDYIMVNKAAAKFRKTPFPHFDALNMVFKKRNMIENNPHIHNGVVDEFEMLHDEVLTVEGLTDEERQLAYVKLVRHDELRVSFSHRPAHEKKEILMNLLD